MPRLEQLSPSNRNDIPDHGHRNIDIRAIGQIQADKRLGGNTDDGVKMTVQLNRIAYDVRIAIKSCLPEVVANNGHGDFAQRLILFREKIPAPRRLDLQE